MVTEHALIPVRSGAEPDFEKAFAEARALITAAPGCESARLLRCIELPSTYLLLVEWESLEAHTEGFRGSPVFAEWRRIIGPYFDGEVEVVHYSALAPSIPPA